MNVHIFQHVPFEGIGSMANWFETHSYRRKTTRFFDGEHAPSIVGIDLLVIMGGPMSVNDELELPWLIEEKRVVAEAIKCEIPVLGICLGTQLMASALGARVYPNSQKEIGWFPISAEVGGRDTFSFPDQLTVFHWHGETFDLPAGARRIASSAGCQNQAFQFGAKAIGLQFHLETTPDSARALIENCRNELIPGTYVQSEEALLATHAEHYRAINREMERVLEYLTQS